MIRYCDTSALVKLVVTEPDSAAFRRLVEDAILAFTHEIAYVEMHSAVSRLERTGAIGTELAGNLRTRIGPVWDTLVRVAVDDALVREAAHLTALHPLAAYDAVHLASALRVRQLADGAPMELVCTDRPLGRAAREEGLSVVPES